jgi:hypothetical protein
MCWVLVKSALLALMCPRNIKSTTFVRTKTPGVLTPGVRRVDLKLEEFSSPTLPSAFSRLVVEFPDNDGCSGELAAALPRFLALSDRLLVIYTQTQAVQSVQCFGRKVRRSPLLARPALTDHAIRRAEDCSGRCSLQERQGMHQVSLSASFPKVSLRY